MCRLLGSVSRTPVTVDEVLGEGRGAFLELARRHGDGWGHAWSTGTGLEVRKAPDSALRSPVLADLAANRPAEAALTHLRWATLHLAVRQENTHPFTDGTVAFAHNGSIAPPAALDRLVGPHLANRRAGDTDSERYFLALLTRMRDLEPGAALVRTVEDVVASGAQVKSLNCLLLTPQHLFAVCSYDPESDDDPNYYPLLHRRVGDTVVVTSTGWTSAAQWSRLRNGEMLVVERGTLATTIVPVATPTQVAEPAAG
jgi:predicted glutamine amidotransferase